MAYEDMTYEGILQRMMNRVSISYPNIDTREGSILFNALAPAAVELAIAYVELNNVLNETFVATASREYILLACQQVGMDTSVFEASAGVHKGIFNVEVPIGSRWNCELFNYTVTEYMGFENGVHAYQMECDTLGTSPNNQTGDLTPITDTPTGLNFAHLSECLIEGENERSDNELRDAYYRFVKGTVSDGNVAQYKRWCEDYDGIGHSKIFPLWNGLGSVKVSILSASNRKASDELIADFQEYLDPGSSGMGDGVAPIGAFVTVTTATEVPINISANVTLKDGYSDTSGIDTAISNYLASISYEKLQISYMTIGAEILKVEGVEAIKDLTINNSTDDITIGEEEIPILGTTNWVVS